MFRIDKIGTKRNDQDEIEELEDIVFNKHKKLKSQNYSKFDERVEEEQICFQIDTKGNEDNLKIKETKDFAWQDDDDEIGFDEVFDMNKRKPKLFGSGSKYKDYLEKKFTNLNPVPKWATKVAKKQNEIDEEDDNLERTAGDVLSKKFGLQSDELDYKHLLAINRYDIITGTINSTNFHPFEKVCLLSTRRKVKLFNIDEEKNEKLKELTFEQYGVSQSKFTVDGNQIIMANCYKPGKFYYYDIIKDEVIKVPLYRDNEGLEFRRFALSQDNEWIAACGSKQRIHLMSNKTKEIVADLKINSKTSTLTFSPDSSKLFSHSGEGKVYVFDLRKNNRCVHRFVDEGCITGTSIDISSNQQYVCCGSDSGIANIYDYDQVLAEQAPKPLKRISNLVTSLNKCKFNHNSELLLLSSDEMENALKLVHLPTFKIFSNIPGVNAKYGTITDCDLSPNSFYLSIANKKGLTKLVRLLYYDKY